MRVLVIGSGGREHALVWKLSQSKLVDRIFCAPGNGGIAGQAECVDIKPEDIQQLLKFSRSEKVELTVVGPEAALSLGIVDEFSGQGLKIFGPCKAAAMLESSKVFSKELMRKCNVPTAPFTVFDEPGEAKAYLAKAAMPCVIKADGLAQGKGVIIAKNEDEAADAVSLMMEKKAFADAGKRIIIEECLEGQEASILVFVDGKKIIPLVSSQDHKRVFDNDKGPNTGGMGAYAPAPVVTQQLYSLVIKTVIEPIISGLAQDGIEYRGVLYAGIMITRDGPKVLEFNVRFGDPETQAILPLLETDLAEAMLACADQKLNRYRSFEWRRSVCVCVVCTSGGYPGDYEKGKEISGLDDAAKIKDAVVFHAGTKKTAGSAGQPSVKYLTTGGRVLGVTGLGDTVKAAIDKAYMAVAKINFKGMHYRKDIGRKAILRENAY